MIVFIDDSGDPGFNFEKGSSKFFIIAAVIFDDELEAEKTAVAIKEYRRLLEFPDDVEFKFSKSRREIRVGFLRAINKYEFQIRSLVIDKSLIRKSELRDQKDLFYSYAIKLLLQHSEGTILNAKVRIDGSGDRVFRRSFLSYLRRQLNSKDKIIMKNCQLVDSKNNVLIQMVDMIAGGIKRSYDKNKADSQVYKTIIKKHIQDEWKFK